MIPFDDSDGFCSVPAGDGLRRVAVRGAAATVAGQGVMLAVQLASTVLLARLLTPTDFGVVSMVTTFTLLLMNFGTNGFTEAVIQRDRIDRYLASNLLWVNVAVGLVLTVAFAATGSLLALFYRNPLVAHVAAGMSISILIASASVMHLALLRRAMRFTAVSMNDVVARLVNSVVTISLAVGGWGYWALVIGVIGQGLSTTVGAWWLCRWVPSLPRRAVGTREVLVFSLRVYARFATRYLASNFDNALVGWRFNAQTLGFYKKAYDLFALPAGQFLGPLTSVALSAFSRVGSDTAKFRRHLLDIAGIITFPGIAFGAILTLTGPDVVRLVLGPNWGEAGRIFVYFGPGMGIIFLYGTHSWIHLSIGRAERWLRWSILECGVTVLLFVLGLRWGPEGVALAWTISYWVLVLPALWYAGKPIGLGPLAFVVVVWRYVLAGAVAGGACHVIVRFLFPPTPARNAGEALVRALATFFVFVPLYVSGVVLLYGGIEPLRRLKRLANDAVRVRGTRRPCNVAALPS